MKKITAALLAIVLLFSITATATATLNVNTEVTATENYYLNTRTGIQSFEEALALATLGYKIDGQKFTFSGLNAADLDKTDGTEIGLMAKFILVALSSGKNPSTYVAGKDLIALLKAKQGADGAFGASEYSHYIAMLALDCAKATYDSEKATQWLVSKQHENGGWAYDDVDTVAMMLWALAGHRNVTGVGTAIDKAIAYIKSLQLENGGFMGWQEESVSTEAVVINALVDLGYDPFSSEFKGLANRFLAFKNEDGSYRMSASSEEHQFDGFSTAQAFLALVSMKNGKSPFKTLYSGGSFSFTEDIVSSQPQSSSPSSVTPVSTPQTSDNNLLMFITLFLAFAVLSLIVSKRPLRNDNK